MPVYLAKLYLRIYFSTLLEVGLIISFKNYKEFACSGLSKFTTFSPAGFEIHLDLLSIIAGSYLS